MQGLREVLQPDPVKNPGRESPSLERINEVLNVTMPEKAEKVSHLIMEACVKANKPPQVRAPLDAQQAKIIEKVLGEEAGGNLARIVTLLDYSEISTAEAIDLHRSHKVPVSHLEADIIPVKGEGVYIVDINGFKYLDVDSNYSAANLGYDNPGVALALYKQAGQLITMKEDRVQVPRARLMRLLSTITPVGLDHFYFQNSGGEAVDKCLKVAKAYTGHTGVVAMENSFHGRTHGAVAVTHNVAYREPFGLHNLDWVHFAPFNDADAVQAMLEEGQAKTVIIELVQSEEAGITPADPQFVKDLRKMCDENGALLIADEVQTGFGRVATKEGEWWASDVYGVTPDLMTIGKSFGGGFPVTAVVTSKKVSDEMKAGYDGSTFGGNPLAMMSALTAINQMKKKNVTKNAAERGRQLKEGLEAIDSSLVKGVKGLGLLVGLELGTAGQVAQLQSELKKLGVKSSLSTANVARFIPPLIISEEEMSSLLEKVDRALHRIG